MKYGVLLVSVLGLAGCVAPAPVVSDFNGDSVKIQVAAITPQDLANNRATADAEALRICRSGGKGRAEYASQTTLPTSNPYDLSTTYVLLYLCLG